ncbi:MAG TPA: Hsp20/alpha crystallin family protein [Vicinamibacterales bacterium]|jgi:HSP20 family protein|nr:Hsp20/alpha crystallin family protein [Vicinamibacterales bacterium]
MANQGSAKQDRPTEQSVPTRRTRQGGEMSRWDRDTSGPFAWMRQMQDQLDRAFNSVWSGGGTTQPWTTDNVFGPSDWSPAIDVFQRGNDLVVRADVPGLSKDDITVDIADDQLTIRGERRYDHEEERDGVFRSERSYGSFCRVVPLPQGAIGDSAKATFNNGVLEIVLQAPSFDVRRGRRIEIKERAPEKPKDQQKT